MVAPTLSKQPTPKAGGGGEPPNKAPGTGWAACGKGAGVLGGHPAVQLALALPWLPPLRQTQPVSNLGSAIVCVAPHVFANKSGARLGVVFEWDCSCKFAMSFGNQNILMTVNVGSIYHFF